MPYNDHEPLVVRQFLGIFDRGDDDIVPTGYFRDSYNMKFFTNGVETRDGTSLSLTLSSVRRMKVFHREGEAQRLIILNNSGWIYDSLDLTKVILNIGTMTDFSMVMMYGRAYITPHNGKTGLPGEKVYVYAGDGQPARPAGGAAPSGFTLTASDSASSGHCEPGTHVIGVAFETVSGFLTAPGGYVAFSPVGGKAIDIGAIPIGPAGTVARVLVSTKAILDYNGDVNNQEYFEIPGGRVEGNIATTTTVSYYDADLQNQLDYILEQASYIPAGVGLCNYRGRLCVWGEDANPAIVRVSKAGYPESFNQVEGFATINPGDSGGGVRNCAVYRKQLLCMKDERTYVTMDNGEEAAFWDVDDVDMSIGTTCHGLATIRDFGDNTEDRIFIASRPGLQMFTGTFSQAAVSYDIDNIWARISKDYFHTLELTIDPVECLLYCAVPLDGQVTPNTLLVMDYQDGFDQIKWTKWVFPTSPTTIVVDVKANRQSVFKFGSWEGNVHEIDPSVDNDEGTAILSLVHMGHFPQDDEGRIWHHTGIRLRIKGSGALDIAVGGEDFVQTAFASSLLLSPTPGRELFRGFNFVNEKCAVKLTMDGINEYFRMTKFVLYSSIEWETRPE